MNRIELRPTELLISNAALENNLQIIKRRLNGKAKLMAVIKADGYGHGLKNMAELAVKNGADMLAVAITEEGVILREHGIEAEILVFGGANPASARAAVQYRLAQSLFDLDTLIVMQEEAARRGEVAKAHIKIDTGMARLGLRGKKALNDMLMALKCSPNVKVEGVFTHFADSVNDPEFTRAQNAEFMSAVKLVREYGHKPIAHAAASAAMLNDESLWHDMVRPGIALYGAEVRWLCPELTPAQKLITRPMRIETVPGGTTIGYGRSYKTERETTVMTLPVGYGDGYMRALSNRAFVLVKGKRAPIIGRICMDMTMVDITGIPGVTLYDEVVLLGGQGRELISPDELAAIANTIPYETMLNFTSRLRRRYIK